MTLEVNPFTDARASALVAKEVAKEVLRRLEEARPSGAWVNVGMVEPISSSFPRHPLDTAVHDLAIATLAASRGAEAAARAGTEIQARAAGGAARSAANTLSLAAAIANSEDLRSNDAERVRVAYAAALTAFAAADLLRDSAGCLNGRAQTIGFPSSWSRLIVMLSRVIEECRVAADEEQENLIHAAIAAHDGADAARRAYERLGHTTTAQPAVCRFVRVASLAAAYAGCAALVPLRTTDGGRR
ncbi:MAG: hypothetical protein ABI473_02770 [Candidatus Dormibacter sp.]